MSQHDPLFDHDAQQRAEDASPEPTPTDLFLAGVITDWQQFVADDEAYRAAQGLPPVPELTPEQERRMWWRIAEKVDARREAGHSGNESRAERARSEQHGN